MVRKIIHVDMDCFYAAIEMRDDPSLENKPVAVGGSATTRGVVCTCNYLARSYGIHSAMSTAQALKLCPSLIVVPVNMEKYKEAAHIIRKIFYTYTPWVEPLSLDEAFLDVSVSVQHQGSATFIAKAIRVEIWQQLRLTASAGVAPNKFLAKIASAWNKPNGLYVIRPEDVATFIKTLPVNKLHGVGKVTARKLQKLGFKTCSDLQKTPHSVLVKTFGKLGNLLFYQAQGIDTRVVEPNRSRKSLSVENTFHQDILISAASRFHVEKLYEQLLHRLAGVALQNKVKSIFVKIKFLHFKIVTAETKAFIPNLEQYWQLIHKISEKNPAKVRLIGLGVYFRIIEDAEYKQIALF